MQFLKWLIIEAYTPEEGKGWCWFSLFMGHVLLGSVSATISYTHFITSAYFIDFFLFFMYILCKETVDYLRGGDFRDCLLDSIAFGFGVYAMTCLMLGLWQSASLTFLAAFMVSIYGTYHVGYKPYD